MQPHVEAQEPLVQQTENNLPADDDRTVFLVHGASPAIEVAPAPPPPFDIPALARYQRVERFVNIGIAILALIVAAPLMLVIAVVVKLTSSGPIFYRQPRIGLNRRGVRLHARRRSDTRWQLWARFLALH